MRLQFQLAVVKVAFALVLQINANDTILPGIKLGTLALDTCTSDTHTVRMVRMLCSGVHFTCWQLAGVDIYQKWSSCMLRQTRIDKAYRTESCTGYALELNRANAAWAPGLIKTMLIKATKLLSPYHVSSENFLTPRRLANRLGGRYVVSWRTFQHASPTTGRSCENILISGNDIS